MIDEFYHLISKHPEEWLNFLERMSSEFGEKEVEYLESRIMEDKNINQKVIYLHFLSFRFPKLELSHTYI